MRSSAYGFGRLAVAAILAVAGLASTASAQTVDEIVKRGSVVIGVVSGVPPFGVVDQQGKAQGYDVDVANLIAKYLGVKAEIMPLAPPARIPALQAKRVDFLVATLGPTPERAKTVMFTMPYSAFQMSIMAPKSLPAQSLDDLKGKSVAVPRGSPQDTRLTALAASLNLSIKRFDDDATAAQAVFSGQVDAAALPNTTINDIVKQNPSGNAELKFSFFQQPNSIALRKEQFDLLQWLNNTIYFMKNSGELDEIHRKWIGTPLPELPVF